MEVHRTNRKSLESIHNACLASWLILSRESFLFCVIYVCLYTHTSVYINTHICIADLGSVSNFVVVELHGIVL